MNVGLGVALILAGSALSLATVFGAWRRLAFPVALAVLAACGALVGAGALLVQHDVTTAEWSLTLVTIGVLTPLHARLVFGRPGASR